MESPVNHKNQHVCVCVVNHDTFQDYFINKLKFHLKTKNIC